MNKKLTINGKYIPQHQIDDWFLRLSSMDNKPGAVELVRQFISYYISDEAKKRRNREIRTA